MNQFLRNMHGLILRDIRSRLGQNPLSLLWVLAEPILHVCILLLIKVVIRMKADRYGIDISLFLISGLVPYFLFRNCWMQIMRAPRSNAATMAFPAINTFDIVLSRLVVEFVISISVFIIMLSGAYFYFNKFFIIEDPLNIILMYTNFMVLGTGFGLFCAPLIGRFHFIDIICQLLGRILYFTSGIIFPITFVPYEYRQYLVYNPLIHMVEMLRDGLFEKYTANPMFTDWQYAFGFSLVALFLGLVMIKKYEHWAYDTPK